MDQDTALAQNLTFYSGDHFVIRADHKTKLSSSGPGRNSVRLQSNKKYTTHVTVFVPPCVSAIFVMRSRVLILCRVTGGTFVICLWAVGKHFPEGLRP